MCGVGMLSGYFFQLQNSDNVKLGVRNVSFITVCFFNCL